MAFEVCKFGTGVYKTCCFCGKGMGELYCGLAKGSLESVKIENLNKCPLTIKNREKKRKEKK